MLIKKIFEYIILIYNKYLYNFKIIENFKEFKVLDYKEFRNKIVNNKSYFKEKKYENFLSEQNRNLFLNKIKENIEIVVEEEEKNTLYNLIEDKEQNDMFLFWIYYKYFFLPILENKKHQITVNFDSKNNQNNYIFFNIKDRYFSYNNYFLTNNEYIVSENSLLSNKMATFDYLLFKQSVNMYDYSNDYLLGTHKILLDVSTDTVVVESLQKYVRNEPRIRPSFDYSVSTDFNKDATLRIILRKYVKQKITSSEANQVNDYFLKKINIINLRREKLLNYLFLNEEKSSSYYDYLNYLIYILGKKIKILFLIRQVYSLKNFLFNYKYLIILRKKLCYIIKEEKIIRKKMLVLKKKKNRHKIKNILDKEDSFYYKRRTNYYNFCNIMERKKTGKFSNFFFSSITDMSLILDIDGSKYFNSYLKHTFRNTMDEEKDSNTFFRENNYNLNYMNYKSSMEHDVLNYYKSNKNVKEFLKGLNNYKYTTYNYAHPHYMQGDILEVEALFNKMLFENRKIEPTYMLFTRYYELIKQNNKNSNNLSKKKIDLFFDFNDFFFDKLPKSKTNFLTFSKKKYSYDEKTSIFFEFFLFGHIMFSLLGLNQKFNFYFCFNFLSRDYLNKNEFLSLIKNNTLSSKYLRSKNIFKSQYLLLLKDKIWFNLPVIKKFYYSYFVSFIRFIFFVTNGLLFTLLNKKTFVFYFCCKIYLFLIDTLFLQIIFIIPLEFIRILFQKIITNFLYLINSPYYYSDVVRFSYKIQCYLRIPGYSMFDLNNFVSYFIASPYIYVYEKTLIFIIKNFFLIFDLIFKLISLI